jgi:signal transduction histidine kinase
VHTARSVGEERLRNALEGAEQERTRWARELHDETLQGLGSLQLLLSSALRQPDAEQRDAAVRVTLDHIADEIDKLRTLITELRPAELDELGLESALEALVERRDCEGEAHVELEADLGSVSGGGPRRFDPHVESAIYRLVQEALSNAAKHADATRVSVRVTVRDAKVEVVVRDDGRGFDTDASTAGFGLLGMRERVALVGGTLAVTSRPGEGTEIQVVLPLPVESAPALSR